MTSRPGSADDGDRLFDRLQEQLEDMELADISHGMTAEDLAQKGLTGEKPIEIQRSSYRHGTKKEHLEFEPGIDFKRLPDTARIQDVDIESLLSLTVVEHNKVIAVRSKEERTPFHAGQNVCRESGETHDRFIATIRGRPVILRDRLHIVPADIDSVFSVNVRKDRMNATLTCTPSYGKGQPLSRDAIIAHLYSLGICHGLDEEKLDETIDTANQTKTKQENVLIASGTMPTFGSAGHVEYLFQQDDKEYDFQVLPDGRIDYRKIHTILMAQKGDLLARIHDPQPGVPGKNIMGEEVPAGTKKGVKLLPGKGVRISDDGKEFYADISGSIMLTNSILEVVKTYVVNSDVSYATGNIEFVGNVYVNGNVLEGFEVKAEGDIIITKNVEGARIEAGRDIYIKCGIQGKGKGLVAAGRDIHVEYTQNARLEAQGCVSINNYAIHSSIFTSKSLEVLYRRGSIIGGEVYAQRGVDVLELGSDTGTKTYIEVGTDFLVLRKLGELDEVITYLNRNIRKIEETLKPILALAKTDPGALQKKKEIIHMTLEKLKQMKQQRMATSTQRFELSKQLHEKETCFVKVKRVCRPDVTIKIRGQTEVIREKRENVRFYEDEKNNRIGIAPY